MRGKEYEPIHCESPQVAPGRLRSLGAEIQCPTIYLDIHTYRSLAVALVASGRLWSPEVASITYVPTVLHPFVYRLVVVVASRLLLVSSTKCVYVKIVNR